LRDAKEGGAIVELGFPDAKMTGLSIQYDIDGIQGEGLA
jgi:hypothetical protein